MDKMNAIDIIKERDFSGLGEVSEHINRLDLEVGIIKSEIKIDLNTSRLPQLRLKTEELKVLQGYLNSMIAKREVLTNIYNEVIAHSLIRNLFCKLESTHRDIEFGDIKVVCRRGGFDLSDRFTNEFIPADYRQTEIYRTIKCY